MTHPIQYNAPWIRLLAERRNIEVKVFYTWGNLENEVKFDTGFKKNIVWDIPLLSGYDYEFVENTARKRNKGGYSSIVNPGLVNKIEKYKPDAILVNGWNYKSHRKCINYFHNKIPVLFRGDSTLLDASDPVKKVTRKIILTAVYKNVDYAFYAGTQNKKYFLEYGLKEKNLVFAPHAVDNTRFAPGTENKRIADELKCDLKIGAGEQVFLFAGKFQQKKNVVLLLDAFHDAQ